MASEFVEKTENPQVISLENKKILEEKLVIKNSKFFVTKSL